MLTRHTLTPSFEVFDTDPFWVPRTEEELEDLGEHSDRENIAKRYMDKIRKRKVSRSREPCVVWSHLLFPIGTVCVAAHRRRGEAADAQVELEDVPTLSHAMQCPYIVLAKQESHFRRPAPPLLGSVSADSMIPPGAPDKKRGQPPPERGSLPSCALLLPPPLPVGLAISCALSVTDWQVTPLSVLQKRPCCSRNLPSPPPFLVSSLCIAADDEGDSAPLSRYDTGRVRRVEHTVDMPSNLTACPRRLASSAPIALSIVPTAIQAANGAVLIVIKPGFVSANPNEDEKSTPTTAIPKAAPRTPPNSPANTEKGQRRILSRPKYIPPSLLAPSKPKASEGVAERALPPSQPSWLARRGESREAWWQGVAAGAPSSRVPYM